MIYVNYCDGKPLVSSNVELGLLSGRLKVNIGRHSDISNDVKKYTFGLCLIHRLPIYLLGYAMV